MDHRYGRHGSQAWLKWRQRHYLHPATSLISVTQPLVIHVYIPINVERIIIIVQRPEQFDKENEIQQVNGDTDSFRSKDLRGLQPVTDGHVSTLSDIEQEIVNSSLPMLSDAEREVAEGLHTIAKIDARDRAQEEVQQGFETPPSIQQLEMNANQSARQLIRQQVVAGKRIVNVEALAQMFVRLYLTIYEHEIRNYKDSGVLLNDEEQHIRDTARLDKNEHATQGVILTFELLRYFAVVRAMRYLGLDPELSLRDLSSIDKYVKSYVTYYNQYALKSKEVERLGEPSTF